MELQDRICAGARGAGRRGALRRAARATAATACRRGRASRSDGPLLERAAVHVLDTRAGPRCRPRRRRAAPSSRASSFEAVSLSLIVHPRNPYVPTSHANLRVLHRRDGEPGRPGGSAAASTSRRTTASRRTASHWHREARAACAPFGAELYPRFKKACDEYFFLPHRGEPRGIGGLFFDDFAEGGFAARVRALLRSVGDHYLRALSADRRARASRRRTASASATFQLYRRGRYVEFNLIHDRGTRYGAAVRGGGSSRCSASMPPLAAWRYDYKPEVRQPPRRGSPGVPALARVGGRAP